MRGIPVAEAVSHGGDAGANDGLPTRKRDHVGTRIDRRRIDGVERFA
jgi:hypothetical protein